MNGNKDRLHLVKGIPQQGCPNCISTCGQGFTSGGKNVKIVIVSNFLQLKDFVNEIDLYFAGGTLLYLTKGGILILREMDFTKI